MVSAIGDEIPETRYARSVDEFIAYQVAGSGDTDLLVIPEWLSHQDARWDVPAMADFYRRLGGFARVITFDKRGCGMSDPVPLDRPHTLEEWIDDVTAVMDAVGCDRAAVMGMGAGGPMAMLFAASHPSRVSALVLVNTAARYRRADDYPWGIPDSIFEDMTARASSVARLEVDKPTGFGYGDAYDRAMFGEKMVMDGAFMNAMARWRRMTSSPRTFAQMNDTVMNIDVRPVLPAIDVPTMVLHRRGDDWTRVGNGRYLADHIRGARFVELDGDEHAPFVGDADALVGEVEEFLTGGRQEPHHDRVLATVMFCDLVGSTERVAALGDQRWSEILVAHNSAVRRQLERFRGVQVNTTGDGFVATFDGPARAIRCAAGIRQALRALSLEVRTGLHTGEIVRLGDDIGGVAVHIAARVMAAAEPGELLVSRTVADLIAGSGIQLADRGEHTLKGVPGSWRLYAVTA